jgi:glyoxylase-like metal-dependent hydrolase (beta-lactamase superfamily II)
MELDVTEIAPGVHSLGSSKGGHVRAFLLDDGGELTLVDTLFDGDAHIVLREIDRLGRRVTDLRRIALTHAHRSHLGGLATLARASGAVVHAHEWEADIVGGERRAQPVTILPRQSLRLWPFQIGLWLNRPAHVPHPVDAPLRDGDAFGPLQVLHAPGHSPGHLAFFWPERRFLIAGDAVATWPDLRAGWDAFTLNPVQHAASLARMAALEPQIVGVGHGDPITEGGSDRMHRLVATARRPG